MRASDVLIDIWPAADLEYLGQCPVCGCQERTPLHGPLTDRMFGCAPGEWNLHTCEQCELAYVDPRPNIQTIARAYESYFTHGDSMAPRGGETLRSLIRQRGLDFIRSSLNAFRNRRWGTNFLPSSFWGGLVISLIPSLRNLLFAHMRRLPSQPPYQGAKLLDVGCGDGAFLELAQAAGWQVTGVDFDPKAVAVAQARGVQVFCGGLDVLKQNKGCYEYITCSHVIEHVHSPVRFIAELRELLATNGTLWIQTPNLASFGHSRYGSDWRGLEPPRHLCIFNLRNLSALMKNAGFNSVFYRLPALMAVPVHLSSMEIAQSKLESLKENRSVTSILTLYIRAFWQSQFAEQSEFITLTATRVD